MGRQPVLIRSFPLTLLDVSDNFISFTILAGTHCAFFDDIHPPKEALCHEVL
jgi:hypothetical protein